MAGTRTPLAALLPAFLPDDDLSLPLSVLASLGITSDVDLLFAPSSLPPHPSLPPALFARLRSFAAAHLSAPSRSGSALLQSLPTSAKGKGKQPDRYSSSLPPLDALLAGGFAPGELVELVGPRSSLRTSFVLHVVLLHLLEHADSRVAFVDSTASFDPYRCLAILRDGLVPRLRALGGGSFAGRGGATGEAGEPDDEKLAIEVLDRLSVSRTSRSGEAVDALLAEVSRGDVRIAVVDSVDVLLGAGGALEKGAQGNANLVAFMRRLGTIARSSSHPTTIFLINSAVPATPALQPSPIQPPPLSSLPVPRPLVPSLGTAFPYLVDLSLLFTPASLVSGTTATEKENETVLIEVRKNSRGPAGGLVGVRLVSQSKSAPLRVLPSPAL
ncbi:hypothetical protein JCM5296_001170 [Sporobolomyces johnsonii]